MLEKIELAKSAKGFNARHVFRMLRSKFRNLRNALSVGEANDITWCSASLASYICALHDSGFFTYDEYLFFYSLFEQISYGRSSRIYIYGKRGDTNEVHAE